MKHEFRLADIGEGLEEAEIISWLVTVGDQVSRDQALVEIMTDKSNAELPAPAAGTVVEVRGGVGDMVAVGELIAVIDDGIADSAAAATAPKPGHAAFSSAAMKKPAVELATDAAQASSGSTSRRIKASPSTRRAAAEMGLDLSTVTGSGPGGRILLSDFAASRSSGEPSTAVVTPPVPGAPLTAAVAAPEPALAPVSSPPPAAVPAAPRVAHPTAPPQGEFTGTVPLRGVRRVVAQNMAQSWSEIPHIHSFEQIDAEPMLAMRQQLKEIDPDRYQFLTPLSFFVAAVASALRAHPQANASLDLTNETITYHPSINIGMAVAAPQGLVVPVLHQADALPFGDVAPAIAGLVQGARSGTLDRAHFAHGTATVTNFGSLGGEQASPIIRPPESLIVGFGSVAERPFVIDGLVVARKTMHVVVATDHRLLDGDITTSILQHVARSLTEPLRVVLPR